MKKFIITVIFGLFAAGAAFSCEYNERTHKITECEQYKNNKEYTEQACKDAHNAYNKYVALKLAEKTKEKASRLGNKLTQYIGEKMEENDSKK